MKLNKFIFVAAAIVAVSASSCDKIENIAPQSGTMLESQVKQTNAADESRANASFTGLFTTIGEPWKMQYNKPDDWGVLMMLFCNDLEGADALMPDNSYNWFSVCGELSSRNANYRNPYIRYKVPYKIIADVNTFLLGFGENPTESQKNMIAQALCLRAYAYLLLAPAFQFNYQVAGDEPCVPIVTEDASIDFTQNPRASVKEVYKRITDDLDAAIEILDKTTIARATAAFIDSDVAHGLRARAYLDMGKWSEALADAKLAAEGYSVATMEEVSSPTFMDINEHNWIWGFDMTLTLSEVSHYATNSSWLRSFSADGYSAACQVYCCINTLLYDKIPASDVRKGWWVDEDLKSPLIEGLVWPGAEDVDLGHATITDVKTEFLPYTNVKFGCKTVGTQTNEEDTPLMRVEEMILIQAECLARLGKESDAIAKLHELMDERDLDFDANRAARGLSLLDEIWYQRRVELWGEGFFNSDAKRLQKPVVRFHDDTNNMPDAFRFNLAADDPWLLLRFPQGELNTNFAIVDNQGGHQPKIDEGKTIRDGVTD